MKALTLTQPWASLMAIGAKKIETRSWRTPYRGSIAIHAAKGFPGEVKRFCEAEVVCDALGWPRMGAITQASLNESARLIKSLPVGMVLATARLISCIPTREIEPEKIIEVDHLAGCGDFEITEQEYAFGNYDPGRWAWLFADVKLLPVPDPVKGALSLWEWDDTAYWTKRKADTAWCRKAWDEIRIVPL